MWKGETDFAIRPLGVALQYMILYCVPACVRMRAQSAKENRGCFAKRVERVAGGEENTSGCESQLLQAYRHDYPLRVIAEVPLPSPPLVSLYCMQRRSGKGVAHIAPPLGAPRMGSDPEKASSRLNQKTIGVTNRIWLILILFLALILLTKSILPSETQDPRHRLLHTDLKPKNYLNATNGDTVPFAFCPALGPGDELAAKYDALTLSKTRLHMGSGARVQRVITRALAGFPVTISVIGGSISACHGAGDDPLSPTCYPSRFFNWWNSVFPHPASELTNGAMRRTNSGYFSFCNAHHVPDVTDLVIVELDVDDEGQVHFPLHPFYAPCLI
ncbi:hypothetical protein NLI96_g1296 [Meripilus lineatus]|uniref:Uncharacterized protein n=1 Tax=Meripilus lineatus TaxID=2056292 RepID=A0AAD5VAV4_9APHY|nr:hypothetical protein NLI96_g1296 [Physisporinus lineatus]